MGYDKNYVPGSTRQGAPTRKTKMRPCLGVYCKPGKLFRSTGPSHRKCAKCLSREGGLVPMGKIMSSPIRFNPEGK